MRKMLLAALLAGATAPAIAAADDRSDRRDQARAERAERADRSVRAAARAERSQPRPLRGEQPRVRIESGDDNRSEAPASTAVERRQLRTQRPERSAAPARIAVERNREIIAPVRGGTAPRLRVQSEPTEVGDSVRDWRANERQRPDSPSAIQERNLRRAPGIDRSGEDFVQPTRPLPRVLDRDPTRVSRRAPAPETQAPEPATARLSHAKPSRHWRKDWRRDHRYDWRNHRHRHRSLFRLGFYIDPFGWGYHRYGIGWRLWPSHYSNRYWLSDPWSYRLPPAYGPYRWIRYWDDALLVNLYTGEVVDVVHNFFW